MTIYFNNRIVSAMEWETLDALLATQPARHSYAYTYDGLNRLTAAAHEALLHHEWYGHGIMDYGDATKDHNKAYGLHSKNYPLWLKSTIKFKLDTISKELQYIYLETTKP